MWQQNWVIIRYCRTAELNVSHQRCKAVSSKRTAFAYRFCLFVESTKSGCEDSPAEMGLVSWGSNCITPLNRYAVWPLVLLLSTDVAGRRLLTVTKGQTYTMHTVNIASVGCFYLPQHCEFLYLHCSILVTLEQNPHWLVDYLNWMKCNYLKLLLDWGLRFASFKQNQEENAGHNGWVLVQSA